MSGATSLIPIESVPLGSRIGTKNPQVWDYDDSLPEPDSYSWSKIELTITRDDGVVIDVELLRPDQWILDHSVFVGSELLIHVAELDVDGIATVTALSACPGLAAGDGEVVTGRFVTRQVAETIRITLTDGTLLEGTPVHPIWSVDRGDFIALSELQPGERLQSAAGPQAIATVQTRHLPVPVYNIEVRGQHVYEVTDAGILVHNAQPCLVDPRSTTGSIYSSRTASEVAEVAAKPTSVKQLQQKLGRAGLIDSSKVRIIRAAAPEVPDVPGMTFYGWVSQTGSGMIRDHKGRFIIKITDDGLRSLETAVATVGHELHHVKEALAGAGASESAANAAGEALLKKFLTWMAR